MARELDTDTFAEATLDRVCDSESEECEIEAVSESDVSVNVAEGDRDQDGLSLVIDVEVENVSVCFDVGCRNVDRMLVLKLEEEFDALSESASDAVSDVE